MTVLKKKELEESPLADLHAIASELGLEGFRSKRKNDLITAILEVSGSPPTTTDEERDPDEVPAEEALEAPTVERVEEDEEEEESSEESSEETSEDTSEDTSEGTSEGTSEDEAEEPDEAAAEREEELATGVLDILANGSGFVRVDPAGQSRDDVYVSPAQIRRCELRAGDLVGGPLRPPRRNERHPSLIRVATVNGTDAEPPEERPWFSDLTAVFPSARIDGPASLRKLPFGRGSRVAVAGPPGAGASRLLHELAAALASVGDIDVQVVLAGVRPEEVGEWRTGDLDVVGGSFERSADAQTQAAELAVERAKRTVERGGHAAVVVDSLAALPGSAQRRVFGAARATGEGGTLTVIAATGDSEDALRWATTRIVLDPGGKPGPRSGTLREDALK
jgi:transcription termination factor Rho